MAPFTGATVSFLVAAPVISYLHAVIRDFAVSREQLTAAKVEAELASHSKSMFLANMSHELRTPLNAIIGFADFLGSQKFGPLGDSRYLQYVKDISDSGRHLLGLITDVLDISKVESGTLSLSEETVDTAEVVRACARLVRDRMEGASVALELDLSESLPLVWADARRLKQAILNLLSNAAKFTQPGGRVSVHAKMAPEGVELLVADTGIGMSQADLKMAMKPFGQVESSLSRRYSGTGLGLPLAKSLIELHGGRLSIDTAPGRGTRVTILIAKSRFR